jgi:quinol-cytochrome oxidoreductase complex cytochrome b subunit
MGWLHCGNPKTDFSVYIFTTFLIAGLTLIHLILLHKDGSNSPIGSDTGVDDVPFTLFFSQRMFLHYFAF